MVAASLILPSADVMGPPSITPFIIKNVLGSPMIPPIDLPKARLKPTTTHKTLITDIQIKLCSMVDSTFFLLTIPP